MHRCLAASPPCGSSHSIGLRAFTPTWPVSVRASNILRLLVLFHRRIVGRRHPAKHNRKPLLMERSIGFKSPSGLERLGFVLIFKGLRPTATNFLQILRRYFLLSDTACREAGHLTVLWTSILLLRFLTCFITPMLFALQKG